MAPVETRASLQKSVTTNVCEICQLTAVAHSVHTYAACVCIGGHTLMILTAVTETFRCGSLAGNLLKKKLAKINPQELTVARRNLFVVAAVHRHVVLA